MSVKWYGGLPWDDEVPFKNLSGKTITNIEGLVEGSENVLFECSDGTRYEMYHEQDCCESVDIYDICGDVNCLLNTPITMAEERSESGDDKNSWGTYTWTFYKLATVKGYVTIRWYGCSNGYYSESVDFIKIPDDKFIETPEED